MFVAIACSLISASVVYFYPAVEMHIFIQGTAKLVSLFIGAQVLQVDSGWLLYLPSITLLVSKACSGTNFFIITCTLLGWHLADKTKYHIVNIGIVITVASFFSVLINALRIACLSLAHHLFFPFLPENYIAFAHMLVGVAVFLPALIGLNAIFEFYGKNGNE